MNCLRHDVYCVIDAVEHLFDLLLADDNDMLTLTKLHTLIRSTISCLLIITAHDNDQVKCESYYVNYSYLYSYMVIILFHFVGMHVHVCVHTHAHVYITPRNAL